MLLENVYEDSDRNNRYIFYTRRPVTEAELRRLVAVLISGKKRIGRNATYKVSTPIGLDDRIFPGGW
jgi:hypothetical protein